MRKNVIFVTEYYMEGIINLVETARLSIGIYAVPTYDSCLELITTIPNLIGVVVIEHHLTKKSYQFYKKLIVLLDQISYSREQNLVVSIIHRNKNLMPKILSDISSSYIHIYLTYVMRVTEEVIKFDGLVPIILDISGVFQEIKEVNFEYSQQYKEYLSKDSFIRTLLTLLDSNIVEVREILQLTKFPEIKKIGTLLISDEYEKELLSQHKIGILRIFCEEFINKRNRV